MTGTSSCRPARLVRFEGTLDAVADGLARRRGDLDDALAAYRASCSVDYRVPTVDTTEVLRSFGSGLRDFGHWVGDVGRAFESAGAAEAFMGTGTSDFESVVTIEDDMLLDYLRDELDPGEDPYRGIPEGLASEWADSLGLTYDQDEPPAWIDYLESGGNAADLFGPILENMAATMARMPEWASITVRVEGSMLYVSGDDAVAAAFAAQLNARVRLPGAYAPRVASAARWVNRTGLGLAFAAGAASQWYADADLPTPERIGRATTRGAAVAGGGFAGGAALGLVCGPGAPVCSTVTGILGAFGGAWVGDQVADLLPWMDSNEPLPAEHDLDDVTDLIAGSDEVDQGIAATVDLTASDMALQATADDPAFQERVESVLPDRERLETVVATGERPEDITTTRTTTTTTTVPPPSADESVPEESIPDEDHLRDPWVAPRPYE